MESFTKYDRRVIRGREDMRNPAIGKAFRWLKRNLFGGEVRIIPKLILYFILIVFS